jgi:hypothetical protein
MGPIVLKLLWMRTWDEIGWSGKTATPFRNGLGGAVQIQRNPFDIRSEPAIGLARSLHQ